MKANAGLRLDPFSPGPISGRDLTFLFVNRKEELEKATDFISFHELGVILVMGDRGIGKTSFLRKLAHNMPDDALVANIISYRFDLDRIGFLRGILLTLLRELKDRTKQTTFQRLQAKADRILNYREETSRQHLGAEVLGIEAGREKEVRVLVKPNIYDIQELLGEVLRESTKLFRRVVLLIDELDKATPEIASSLLVLARPLFSVSGVFLIVVIDKATMEYLGHEIRVVRSISDSEVILGPMTKSDSVELIERRLKSARAPNASRTELFDEQALAAVLDYSHGNPRSLLVMCSRLFGALLKEKRSKITYSDIVRAMEEERKVRLSMLQDREVRLLRMIEEHGSINAGDAEISKVLGVSRPRASQILRGLLQMGILVMRRKGKFVYYSVPEALKPLSESAASGD